VRAGAQGWLSPRLNPGSPLFIVAGKVEREKERGTRRVGERRETRAILPLLAILVVPQSVISLASRRPLRTTPIDTVFVTVYRVPSSLDFSSSLELRSDHCF